jgi:hypothetical protein
MFVVMSLVLLCLQRVRVLFVASDRPSAPAVRAQSVAKLVAAAQRSPLACIHAPTPRLNP